MKLLIADLNGSPLNGETAVGTVLLEQTLLSSIDAERIFFTPSGRKRKGDVIDGVYEKISSMNDVFDKFDVVHINSQSFGKKYPMVKHESITCQIHAPTCFKAYNLNEFFKNIDIKTIFAYADTISFIDNFYNKIEIGVPFVREYSARNLACVNKEKDRILFASRFAFHKMPKQCIEKIEEAKNFYADFFNAGQNSFLKHIILKDSDLKFSRIIDDSWNGNLEIIDGGIYFARFCCNSNKHLSGRPEIVILECMDSGIVPIVSENFFGREIIEDENAISIDCLHKLNDSGLMEKIIGNNYKKISEYDIEKTFNAFLEEWKTLIKEEYL